MTAGEQEHDRPTTARSRGADDRAAPGGGQELALLVSLLIEDPDLAEAEALRRVARQMRLCADIPELAAALVDGDPRRLDVGLLRRTAARLGAPPRSEH